MSDSGYEFPPVGISLDDLQAEGPILDIGGGGEGAIGRLIGRDVVSIDRRVDELNEAPQGPQKVVMDARNLGFPDDTFHNVTAFFSMMYVPEAEDLQGVFGEASRVLQPGGTFHIWDVDLPANHPEDLAYYVVYIRYTVNGEEFGTGYGMRWPDGLRDEAVYIDLAERFDLLNTRVELNHHTFYLQFTKAG